MGRPPALLRSRVWHTWWIAIPLVAVLLVSESRWESTHWLAELLEWLGYPALIVCVIGRIICSLYIAGRKTTELVTGGPYSIVRNPLYVFSFVGVLGIGLTTSRPSFAALLAALFILYYRDVVRREEGALLERYGETFAAYMASVPRWIPRFSLWRSPARVEVDTRLLFRTARDAAWFFVAFPALELIESMHDIGLLPLLFRLP